MSTIHNHKIAIEMEGGGANRNLSTPDSDVDMKYFVLPTYDELYYGNVYKFHSTSTTLDIEIHDVRKLEKLFFQANLSYYELLYSVKIKANYPEMAMLIDMKDEIVKMNVPLLFSSAQGIYYTGWKGLTNGNSDEQKENIAKYGYNPKKASIALHSLLFLKKFADGNFSNFQESIWYEGKEKEFMLDVKQGKLSLEEVELLIIKESAILTVYENIYKRQKLNKDVHDELKKLLRNFVKKELLKEIN